jgi:hypothetical protein
MEAVAQDKEGLHGRSSLGTSMVELLALCEPKQHQQRDEGDAEPRRDGGQGSEGEGRYHCSRPSRGRSQARRAAKSRALREGLCSL